MSGRVMAESIVEGQPPEGAQPTCNLVRRLMASGRLDCYGSRMLLGIGGPMARDWRYRFNVRTGQIQPFYCPTPGRV